MNAAAVARAVYESIIAFAKTVRGMWRGSRWLAIESRQFKQSVRGQRGYRGATIASGLSAIPISTTVFILRSQLPLAILLPILLGLWAILSLNVSRRDSANNLRAARHYWIAQLVVGAVTIIAIVATAYAVGANTGDGTTGLVGSLVLVIPLAVLWERQRARFRNRDSDLAAAFLVANEEDKFEPFQPLPAQPYAAARQPQGAEPLPVDGAVKAAQPAVASEPAQSVIPHEIVSKPEVIQPNPAWTADTPETVIAEIEAFKGQDEAGHELIRLIKGLPIQKRRVAAGAGKGQLEAYNYRFEGPPGTGKTTFAMFLARALLAAEIVEHGQIVVAKARDLIGGAIGQSAHLTQSTIDQSRGGILMVDEAYKLRSGDPNSQDGTFKKDALDTLVEEMGRADNGLTVIFCGYPDDIQALMKMNDGLTSRFTGGAIPFRRYDAEDLTRITTSTFLPEASYQLTADAATLMHRRFEELLKMQFTKQREWGNARDARTICTQIAIEHRYRLAEIETTGTTVSDEAINLLEKADVDSGFDSFIGKRDQSGNKQYQQEAQFQPLQVPTEPVDGITANS